MHKRTKKLLESLARKRPKMQLSELIATLQDLEGEFGDMPVFIELAESDNELYLNYAVDKNGQKLVVTNVKDDKQFIDYRD